VNRGELGPVKLLIRGEDVISANQYELGAAMAISHVQVTTVRGTVLRYWAVHLEQRQNRLGNERSVIGRAVLASPSLCSRHRRLCLPGTQRTWSSPLAAYTQHGLMVTRAATEVPRNAGQPPAATLIQVWVQGDS
jgi:hypothetical protein